MILGLDDILGIRGGTWIRDDTQARIQGALGPARTPGTEARVPSSQRQKEGTLVSLEWLFNIIQA